MESRKIFWHIFPANLLVLLGAMLAVTVYASSALHTFYMDQMSLDLQNRAHLIEVQVSSHIKGGDYAALEAFCRHTGRKASTRITVVLADGRVIADSDEDSQIMDNHGGRPEIVRALSGESGSSLRYSKTLGQQMLYVAVPLFQPFVGSGDGKNGISAGAVSAIIRMSMSVSMIDQALHLVQMKIALGAFLVIVLFALITMFISRRISKPLEDMTDGAKRFMEGKLDVPLSVSSMASTEVADLSTAMNRMATQLQKRIHTIERQHNELKTVFSSMLGVVVIVDTSENVVILNKAAMELFHVSQEKAQGKNIQEIVRNLQLLEVVSETLSSEKPVEREIIFSHEEGDLFFQTSGVRLYEGSGDHCFGALLVLNDVSQTRRLENMRRDFVANVSHELKTPITSIKGYAETLLDCDLDDSSQTRKFLEIIDRQSGRLHAIVDDLLSLSRIEQEEKQNEIILKPGRVKEVLQTAIQLCSGKAAEKNITLVFDCDKGLEAGMDVVLLEQAVTNLLINAVKYSNSGSEVELGCSREDYKGQEMIAISVRDHGCGIGREHLPRLFERFYRSDKARSRKLGGTGLGLAIVKHIATAHHGAITVASELGKGSTFTLHLPLRKG